jgi:hypothetical protein
MSVEYLLVVYNGDRDVPADGDRVGVTNHTILLAPGIGTSWNLSPVQLQESIDAGRILLRQHPCFQRLLLDLKALPAPAEPEIVRKSCPFEDDKTLQRLAPLAGNR